MATEKKTDGATAVADAPAPTKWQQPYCEVGMPVYWYPDGDRGLKPHAASITEVATGRIAMVVHGHGGGYMTREGVKHVDDPTRCDADDEEGAWEHTPFHCALLDLVGAPTPK